MDDEWKDSWNAAASGKLGSVSPTPDQPQQITPMQITPLAEISAAPSTSTPSSTTPAIPAPPSSTGTNATGQGTSYTDSYNKALNTYADMRKTGIEMEKGPQATTSTLPGLNQATATSLMGGTATPKAPAMASSMRDVNGNLASPAKPQPQNPMIGMMSMMQNFAANNAALPKPPAAASSMRDVNGNLI